MAIHQPNFFPWLGFFDKVRRSDVFVFLDDVPLQKTGGSYVNRVGAMSPSGEKWISVPISRVNSGFQLIRDVEFASSDWAENLTRKLHGWYRSHPFYDETMSLIEELLSLTFRKISEFNVSAITRICHEIGLENSQFLMSSSFPDRSSSNHGICEIVDALGSGTYLSGEGARSYFEPEVFDRHGIEVVWQGSIALDYPQMGQASTIRGLSIIDCLMNIGQERTRGIVAA